MVRKISISFLLSLVMCVCVSAQNTKSINDFEYVQAVHRKSVNYDYRSVQNDEGREVLLETAPNSGAYAGIVVGADLFSTNISPVIGGEIGYHGRRFMFAGNVTFGYDKYNEESDRAGELYMTTNFQGELGVRAFDFPSKYLHQREFWFLGSYGYKVRQNYNVFTHEAYDGELKVNIKGSTMTVGVGCKAVFKNHMNMTNWYVKGMVYTGHEYYIDGSRLKLGATLSVGFNFIFGKKMKNHKAIKNLFGSEEKYREALKTAGF